jgi:hypothetical protein
MRSRERCGVCGIGKMTTYTTRAKGSRRTNYLRCSNDDCKNRGKEILTLDDLGRPLYRVTECSTPQSHYTALQAYHASSQAQ